MKKYLPLFVMFLVSVLSCKKSETGNHATLFFHTPYASFPESLSGKVQALEEKNFWAKAEGNEIIKVRPITMADRDSLGWTPDFVAEFDASGDLVYCSLMDENGKIFQKDEILKENGKITGSRTTIKDTLRTYEKISGNDEYPWIATGYDAFTDTLKYTFRLLSGTGSDTLVYQIFNYTDKPGGKALYFFDKEKRVTRYEYFNRNGEKTFRIEMKYNDKGKLSELNQYDKDNKLLFENTFSYEYDDHGNWTKAIATVQNYGVFIEERSYKYFE